MEILFSNTPFISITKKHKVYANTNTNSFDPNQTDSEFYENVFYKAPIFKQGQFGISVFDVTKHPIFSKKIKIGYPDGTIEYKTIKYNEEFIIKQVGTLIDLDPDAEGEIYYISQHLLNSNSGIALTNNLTYYLRKISSTYINTFLLLRYNLNKNPTAVLMNQHKYYNELDPTKKAKATVTSRTISKTNFDENYEKLNTEEYIDFTNRIITFQLNR